MGHGHLQTIMAGARLRIARQERDGEGAFCVISVTNGPGHVAEALEDTHEALWLDPRTR